ncbi:hypothetical protein KHQ81_12625 [Mycoplasmatota bacterium]|nr:hypothetical protein KHQ81_12625 [Mycoplasmatota bacterium]
MKTGVYAKRDLELTITEQFILLHYRKKDYYGTKLYREGKLLAIVERKLEDSVISSYSFLNNKNEIISNTDKYVNILNEEFDWSTYEKDVDLLLKDSINLIDSHSKVPSVSEVGIARCLKIWTLGISFNLNSESLYFYMQTNKLQYVFSISKEKDNIYCGISINIPYDNGLFGGGQYFRIRNYKDNKEAYCWWICDLGEKVKDVEFNKNVCENGKCIQTNQGTYWTINRFTDDQIVLQGCGNDEYVYNRNNVMVERFLSE